MKLLNEAPASMIEIASELGTPAKRPLGWRIWGLGIAAMGGVDMILGKFDPGQPVPTWVPGRTWLAYAADIFMVVAGLTLQVRPAAARASVALTAFYFVLVVLVMNGPILVAHPATYGSYEAVAEQLALTAAGFITCATLATLNMHDGRQPVRIGQATFGVCAIVFGGAHFAYMDLTAPLVPRWLPPSQVFWGYATGLFHIAAGLAIVTGVQARTAAILLTVMFASFSVLVHLPLIIGQPNNAFFWTENALNLALIGSAWVVADSLRGGGYRA